MRLLLSSLGPAPALMPHLTHLLRDVEHPRAVVVPNASDPAGPRAQGEASAEYRILAEHGIDYAFLDLRNYYGDPALLARVLARTDLVYVPGGNTFVLRWHARESGFDVALRAFVDRGGVYAGASAGAVVMGPSLHLVDLADDPREAPGVVQEGFGIVPFTVLPHADTDEYGPAMTRIAAAYEREGRPFVAIADGQAVLVDGGDVRLGKDASVVS